MQMQLQRRNNKKTNKENVNIVIIMVCNRCCCCSEQEIPDDEYSNNNNNNTHRRRRVTVLSDRALYAVAAAVAALLLLTLLYTLFLAIFTPRHLSLSLRSARLLQPNAANSDLALSLSLSYHVANPNAFPVRITATSAEVRRQDGASLASVGVPVGVEGRLAAGASQNVAATLAMHVRRQRKDAVLALMALLTVQARGNVFHVFSPRVNAALACTLHVDLLLANSSVSVFDC